VNTKTPVKKAKVHIRRWREEDFAGLVQCQKAVYQSDFPTDSASDRRLFELEFKKFPEGQVLAECNGRIVGYACAIIVQLDDAQPYYTYSEITGDSTFSTHDPSGDTLYGADIAVHPDFRGSGIAGLLYGQRMRIMKRYNLRRMVAHGRLPNYHKYVGQFTPEQYVHEVQARRILDPALIAHFKAGYSVKAILFDQLVDRSSMNYTTWLEKLNPDFSEAKRRIASTPIKRPVRRIRVCTAQCEMKSITSWEEFRRHVIFFVKTAASYHCHFLLFPELFTLQLLGLQPQDQDDLPAKLKTLAQRVDDYKELFQELAQDQGLYIIGGSHPCLRGEKVFNTSYLFTPTGRVYEQDKLHISRSERSSYAFNPGEAIRVFDTPMARIAILVSYDIEFPELTRLMVKYGAEVLFVPFATDERKAYSRIRFCAHSRAVENCVYVVIAGNVGNLGHADTLMINYAQSAIITPSDFAFPTNSVEAEADANTETVAIAELDISNLLLQRDIGTVRPLFDMRMDLFETQAKVPIEVIRCD
jgi:predicted amidohydrolase/ribosomal protein S18 acetylase RimI-like enzyme